MAWLALQNKRVPKTSPCLHPCWDAISPATVPSLLRTMSCEGLPVCPVGKLRDWMKGRLRIERLQHCRPILAIERVGPVGENENRLVGLLDGPPQLVDASLCPARHCDPELDGVEPLAERFPAELQQVQP